jgi:hypothetical protein
VFQIGFPTSTNFIGFLFHFYLFPALEIDFGGILIWKTCRVGPTCQLAFLITPRPMHQSSSSSWSACRAQHASSRHCFLPTPSGPKPRSPSSLPHCPEPPLARVRPSTEASHPHDAASFAIEFQSARRPRTGPSSNRAPDRRPDRAHCPRAVVEPRSPHRLHHQAEPADVTDR